MPPRIICKSVGTLHRGQVLDEGNPLGDDIGQVMGSDRSRMKEIR